MITRRCNWFVKHDNIATSTLIGSKLNPPTCAGVLVPHYGNGWESCSGCMIWLLYAYDQHGGLGEVPHCAASRSTTSAHRKRPAMFNSRTKRSKSRKRCCALDLAAQRTFTSNPPCQCFLTQCEWTGGSLQWMRQELEPPSNDLISFVGGRRARGCFSDLPPNVLKPAANRAFDGKWRKQNMR